MLNVFRMFGQMGGERVAVESCGDGAARRDPAATACAARPTSRRWPASTANAARASWSGTITTTTCRGPDAAVDLTLAGLPAAARRGAGCTHYRIDEDHSNAYAAWKRMGSPIAPTRQQYAELEAASRLALWKAEAARVEKGQALTFALPRQAVSLVMIEWE